MTIHTDTRCWIVYLDDTTAILTPAFAAATENIAATLLQQALTETPDRGNQLEDYPLHATTDPSTVHLVVVTDEDGPTVSAAFDTHADATAHARELQAHGDGTVTITDVPFAITP